MISVRTLMLLVCAMSTISLFGQITAPSQSPLSRELAARKEIYAPAITYLFSPELTHTPPALEKYVRKSQYLHLNPEAARQVLDQKPELLRLPVTSTEGLVVLDVYRVEIFSERYRLRTQEGIKTSNADEMVFYRGVIEGDENSLVTVSILPQEVRILFSSRDGNYRIHKVQEHSYVLYADRDVYQTQDYSCGVTEEQVASNIDEQVQQRSVLTGNCVEVYFECDYKSYQDNGNSLSNTEAWVAALFNEVSTLYENEDIPVFISDIMVWTTTDPYAGLTGTSAMLNEFVEQTDQNGYDGRLAHLLSTRSNVSGGGIAWIDVLCHATLACAVSTHLTTTIVQFPNYSWNINCVAHEMGHQFGSWHTHNCVWNGNNTQIDDCGSEYGDEQQCYDPNDPILPVDGTIMSYCHLIGVGINFSLGFGPQPGNLIRSEYQNATCNTGVCTTPPCTHLTSPLHLSTLVEVNSNLTWAVSSGADGYRLTIGTSPGSGNIVNNLDVGFVTTYDPVSALPFNSNIYVKIVPYNAIGNSTGCTEEFFTTEPNVAPACTHLTSPLNGATNVSNNSNLFWQHSVGNQQGYKLTVGVTPGGGEILNNFNVGNVNTYEPGPLPGNTVIFVKITPYWSGGDISGCIEESFTTGNPVYCSSLGQSQADEWIGGFSFGGVTNSSGPSGYSNFTNLTAQVSAGGTHPVSITAAYSGQAFTEYFRIWIDFNRDGVFANPEERVFQTTGQNTVSGNIVIPANAFLGMTRMRVSMRYSAYSVPCGSFSWGEVEDYSVNINCNAIVNTVSNSGTGSLRWAVDCVAPGGTITFASGLNGDTISLTGTHIVLDAPVTISTNPANNIWIHGLTSPRVFHVNSGISVTLSGLHLIAGTSTDGGAIRNAGTLTIDDLQAKKHAGINNSKLIKSTGMLMIEGNCTVQ